ncbi:hypothetical protein LCGC14_2947430 [marine sediment metagenome]|uniref:Uncharacterized protein n=1 Tax=marine sediment metagenome TaxID=412755 RepID=A0A0F9A7F6_9ZZZZ
MNSNFDEFGKAIVREIVPYIGNYPYHITGFKHNTANMYVVSLICKQCNEEINFHIMSSNEERDLKNPFRTGMGIAYVYFTNHYQHVEEEEP